MSLKMKVADARSRMRKTVVMYFKNNARWLVLFSYAMVVTGIVSIYIAQRYTIFIDQQWVVTSTGHKIYITDSWDKNVSYGNLVAFRAKGLEPLFENGFPVAKYVVGMPGDKIKVENGNVYVNGKHVGVISESLLKKIGKDPKEYEKQYVVKEGAYFCMGSNPRSYDSRYWGMVYEQQVIARAYAIY